MCVSIGSSSTLSFIQTKPPPTPALDPHPITPTNTTTHTDKKGVRRPLPQAGEERRAPRRIRSGPPCRAAPPLVCLPPHTGRWVLLVHVGDVCVYGCMDVCMCVCMDVWMYVCGG